MAGDQSSADKHMAAAMYSGLISHSDTSEEDIDNKRGVFTNKIENQRLDDASEDDDDKEIGDELDDDPDFMASDTPAEEF